MKRHYLLLLLFLFATFFTISAKDNYSFRALDVKSQLSDNYIQAIQKDHYGFMWFATTNGLNRYDGYHFKRYNTAPSGDYENNITWVAEDYSGTLWIKSPSKYWIYDRSKDCLDDDVNSLLKSYGIEEETYTLFIDEDKNLWCLGQNYIYHYRFERNRLSKFEIPNDSSEIISIVCRENNAFLLLSDGTIGRFNWSLNSIQKETSTDFTAGFHPRIYIDSFSNIWFYVTHGSNIVLYSTKERKWIPFQGQREISSNNSNITTLSDNGDGNIWIGTDNKGFYIYNVYADKLSHIIKEEQDAYTIPSNHVTFIYKDDKETVWIGTSKRGVAYTNLKNTLFKNHSSHTNGDMSSIVTDAQQNVWFGFDGEGLGKYDIKSGETNYYTTENSNITSDLIVSSFLDSQDRLWWATFGGGAFYYKDNRFSSLASIMKKGDLNLDLHYIRKVAEDVDGRLWFATYSKGLIGIDKNSEIQTYTLDNSILNNNYIADLSCKNGRYLYIATGSGVYCLDTATNKLDFLSDIFKGGDEYGENYSNCLFEDTRGFLWIGGRYGLSVYSLEHKRSKHLTTNDGLSNDFIRSITEDNNNNIWVATDHGITHVAVSGLPNVDNYQFKCYPYFEEDGIANIAFNNFSIFNYSNQAIVAGGIGGYVEINTDKAFDHSPNSTLIFTDLYIGNQAIKVDEKTGNIGVVLEENIQLKKQIELDYSITSFALEVSAMDYINTHKISYEYRLSENVEWTKINGNRIYLNKLPIGSHQLQVRVEDSYSTANDWNTLIIKIKPPFWLSWYAYVLYVLVAIALAFGLFVRFKRRNNRILEEKKKEVEQTKLEELNEERVNFFTNISHDLRTPLSLIVTPTEKLLANSRNNHIRETLELIHRNALFLQNEVDQLIDLKNISNKVSNLYCEYGDLCEFIGNVCSDMESLFQKNNIHFSFTAQAPTIEMMFDRNKMRRICHNLLSNALKYTEAGGSVSLSIQLIEVGTETTAVIEVADTGAGISDENKSRIFERYYQENKHHTTIIGKGIGLDIVREYVQLHKGEITLYDNMPKGTVFRLLFPVVKPETTAIDTALLNDKIDDNKKFTILVVEDNKDFRDFVTSCLRETYNVLEAENGFQALQVLDSEGETDIVISDVMMPVMDGIELCRKIKTHINYSHIPVILLTARVNSDTMIKGLKRGADDYLTKPFNIDILLLKVDKLLKWTQNNYSKFSTIDVMPSEITVSNIDEMLLERAIKAVEDNMDNSEFSVEELSHIVKLSRGHLYKKLLSITGRTPVEFIRVIRVKRGRQLLEQSDCNISEIAYQIGFSPKQFSKYFKDEYNCLPSEFKNN